MEKPSTKKPMNILKTMVFLNNFMKIKGCLTNKSDLWKTPSKIYKHYIVKHNYFDPCPSNPKFNGLEIDWKSHNFVNPPYSEIKKWIEKAIQERYKGKISILLIPARTDTKWFRTLLEENAIITFIQGRLHFNDEGPAPFPSMFVKIGPFQKLEINYLTKEELNKNF